MMISSNSSNKTCVIGNLEQKGAAIKTSVSKHLFHQSVLHRTLLVWNLFE